MISSPRRRGTPTPQQPGLIRPDGTIQVRSVGLPKSPIADMYHWLRAARWRTVVAVLALTYLAANIVFALLYRLGGACITNARSDSFMDAFDFSVQTFATIGYGAMAPTGRWANALVTAESFTGLLFSAMATGVCFAKFASPPPRVAFSRVALIADDNGVRRLSFRVANQRRRHLILEATVKVTVLTDEHLEGGRLRRRIFDLPLERNSSPLFQLTWSIFHTIDENSPLYNATPERLAADNTVVVVTFAGTDASIGQEVHTRYTYAAPTILFDHRFKDILHADENGRYIDHSGFHDVETLENDRR